MIVPFEAYMYETRKVVKGRGVSVSEAAETVLMGRSGDGWRY
jgi:hypothetical protein